MLGPWKDMSPHLYSVVAGTDQSLSMQEDTHYFQIVLLQELLFGTFMIIILLHLSSTIFQTSMLTVKCALFRLSTIFYRFKS